MKAYIINLPFCHNLDFWKKYDDRNVTNMVSTFRYNNYDLNYIIFHFITNRIILKKALSR